MPDLPSTVTPAKSGITISWSTIPWIIMFAVVGFLFYKEYYPNASPIHTAVIDPEGVKAGQAYLPLHDAAYADAVEAACQAILAGKPIEDAQLALSTADQAGRIKAYEATVGPALLKIMPAGTTTLTPDQKDHVVAFLRGTAQPFRGKK